MTPIWSIFTWHYSSTSLINDSFAINQSKFFCCKGWFPNSRWLWPPVYWILKNSPLSPVYQNPQSISYLRVEGHRQKLMRWLVFPTRYSYCAILWIIKVDGINSKGCEILRFVVSKERSGNSNYHVNKRSRRLHWRCPLT